MRGTAAGGVRIRLWVAGVARSYGRMASRISAVSK